MGWEIEIRSQGPDRLKRFESLMGKNAMLKATENDVFDTIQDKVNSCCSHLKGAITSIVTLTTIIGGLLTDLFTDGDTF